VISGCPATSKFLLSPRLSLPPTPLLTLGAVEFFVRESFGLGDMRFKYEQHIGSAFGRGRGKKRNGPWAVSVPKYLLPQLPIP
jgi:hypothetical protein